jgi:hypothetical protein
VSDNITLAAGASALPSGKGSPLALAEDLPPPTEPKGVNPFASIDPQMGAPQEPKGENPFAEFPPVAPIHSSTAGAFASHFGGSVLPMAGGMAGAGAGAEAGAVLGAFGGPLGAMAGGFVGGLGGFFLGSAAAESAQDFAIHQLPNNWQDALGQSDRMKGLQEEEHPYASFLGGLLPYAATMYPGAIATKALNLPADATAFQRLMANPVTSRLFGGGVMGGFELGNEATSGQPTDWGKVAIATGFGVVFNRPTRFGEYLSGLGAGPVQAAMAPMRGAAFGSYMLHSPLNIPREGVLNPLEPTVAQSADLGIMGPGITESTHLGGTQQSDATRTAAANAAADEQATLGALPEPDLHAIARRIAPDVFARNDELLARRDSLRRFIDTETNPPPEAFSDLTSKQYEIEAALAAANPRGQDARNYRAQLSDIEAQRKEMLRRQAAWGTEGYEEPPEVALARQHLAETNRELLDHGPTVAAAWRRAADHAGQIEEPAAETPPAEEPAAAPAVVPAEAVAAAEAPKSIEAQRAFIVADRTAQLVAAGMSRPVAEANAHVEAAYYVTRSRLFAGKIGSPEELYRGWRGAKVVQPGGEVAPSPAAEAPAAPAEAAPPADPRPTIDAKAPTRTQHAQMEALAAWQQRHPEEAAAWRRPAAGVATVERSVGHPTEAATEDAMPVVNPDAPFATKMEQLEALSAWQQRHPEAVAAMRRATPLPEPVARVAADAGVDTEGKAPAQVFAEAVEALPAEHVVAEVESQGEAQEATFQEAEKQAEDALAAAPVAEAAEPALAQVEPVTPEAIYGDAATQPIEEIEHAVQQAESVAPVGAGEGGGEQPGAAAERPGPVPEERGPRAGGAGAEQRAGEEGTEGLHAAAAGGPGTATAGEPAQRGAEPVQVAAPLLPTEANPALPAPSVPPLSNGGGIEALDPATIGVDAARFQFKANADEAGVTERLQGIEKWDPRLAGTALVWRDADGKNWIADGHQRLALANRLTAAGQTGIRINAFVLDAAEGITEADARVIAAVKNIAEGTGTAIDAAKIIREAAESGIELPPLPPRSTLVRDGQALAGLSPDAFGMVVNDLVPVPQAAIVGRLVRDPLVQVEAMRVLAKAAPDNVRQAEMIVRDVLETGTERVIDSGEGRGGQGDMWGDKEFASSIVLERAKIADAALRQLTRDKTVFRVLSGEAERIQGHGENVLDVEANRSRLTADEQAKQLFTQLATRKGPVSDALSAVARRLKSGEISATAGAREFLDTIRSSVAEELDEGAGAGGAIVGAARERELAQPAVESKPTVDLLGRPIVERAPPAGPEPTIHTDPNQAVMPGMEPSAVQAQAARDQAGRGGIGPAGEVRAADEGLFAPKEDRGRELFQDGRAEERELAPEPEPANETPKGRFDREGWNALLAKGRENRDRADHAAASGESLMMRSPNRRGYVVVSPDVRSPYPGGWRVTSFDEDGEAIGHFEARTAQDAYREMFNTGYSPVDEGTGKVLYQNQRGQIPLYSPVERAVVGLRQAKGTGEQMLAQITRTPGVKPEEVKWLGLDDWLRGQKSVTREEIAGYVAANVLDVREVVKGNRDAEWDRLYDSEDKARDALRESLPDQLAAPVGRGVSDREGVLHALAMGWIKPDDLPEPHREAAHAFMAAHDDLGRETATGGEPKFAGYVTPGGENYRELLITLPEKVNAPELITKLPEGYGFIKDGEKWGVIPTDQIHARPFEGLHPSREAAEQAALNRLNYEANERAKNEAVQNQYRSGHWDEPNVLAHIRFDERAAADGARVLHINEVQSDWHQAGRKRGYQDADAQQAKANAAKAFDDYSKKLATKYDLNPEQNLAMYATMKGMDHAEVSEYERLQHAAIEAGAYGGKASIPDAPFKTSWPALALKRAIKYAVDNGFDRVTWDTGETQAARYDLSKQVSRVRLENPVMHGTDEWRGDLIATDLQGKDIIAQHVANKSEIADLIGKEAADKLINDPNRFEGRAHVLEGNGLRVGGQGMAGFYDKILPSEVNKIIGKFGAKVGESEIPTGKPDRDTLKPDAEAQKEHGAEWDLVTAQIHALEAEHRAGGQPPGAVPLYERLNELHAQMIDETLARSSTTLPVHAFDITPALRTAVESEGLPLFQKTGASHRGKITISPGEVRSIITLARDSDASTFMHETSHDWLKQLMMDAAHPLAPGQLRTDAATVRTWLKRPEGWTGFRPDGTVDREPQERWARTFEQYLREGTAPSSALARVFHQFKQWLTQIYRTLKGLGAPINEDIRGVFDRLLEAEPERTTYSPERDVQPSLATIHEADAAETEPRHAEAVMDRVISERDRRVAQHPPEIAGELSAASPAGPDTAEPLGETGAGTSGRAEVAGVGGQPQPVPAGRGGGAGGGEVERGGGKTGPEGNGLPNGTERAGEQRRPVAGPATGAEQFAPKPADTFPDTGETDAVDLAGNIRVRNLTPENFRQAIFDSAERNDEFRNVRPSLTKGQISDLADSMNLDPSKLDENKLGEMFGGTNGLAPKVLALRRAIVQSAETVWDLMRSATEPTAGDKELGELAIAIARHDMIQSSLSSVTHAWGQTGNAFHSLLDGWGKAQDLNQLLRDNTGRDLYQLKMIAKMGARLDTPGKVSKFLRDAGERSFGRMILEYWINGLISGISTHVTYMVGNAVLAAEKAGPETTAAWAIGALRARMGREGERVRLGEVGAQFGAAVHELPAAVQSAIEAYRSGVTTMLPGESARPMMPFQGDTDLKLSKNQTNAPVTWHEVGADAYGLIQGMRDGIVASAELVRAGGVAGAPTLGWQYSPLGQIPNLAYKGVQILPLGDIARFPGRNVAAIHSTFRSLNYSMEINAMAYRQASEEGLTGAARNARVSELRQDPTDEMMDKARLKATDLTLMGPAGKWVAALSKWINTPIKLPGLGETPILKFVDPFVHIAANIMRQSLGQRTPIGLLSPEIRADLMGRNGNVAQDTAAAKMLVGSAIAVTFGGLAAQGLASGSGPSDPAKSAMWRLAGNQAHSVRIGDMWYAVNRLGPMGVLLSVAADMYDVAHQIGTEDADVVGKSLVHAFTQNILDESFMRGPADLIKAMTESDRYGASYVRTFLSSFMPYSVGMAQIARATDPYARQARTIMDTIRAKTPGLSDSLFPRRDIWGDPMPGGGALIHAGVTAIYARQMSTDPVNLAMLALGVSPAPVERSIRGVPLTDQQYDDFARLAGRGAKIQLDKIVRAPVFQSWPNATKYEVIEETIRQSREAARGLMMMKNPDIPREAAKHRIARVTGQPVAP